MLSQAKFENNIPVVQSTTVTVSQSPSQFYPYPSVSAFNTTNASDYRNEKTQKKAWEVYSLARFSNSDKPAMLYKNTELHGGAYSKKLIEDFQDGDDLVQTGRLYSSANYHCWPVNAAWVLAQIHKGREFVMFSDFSGAHAMRTHDSSVYSALTKEVASAFKAGYEISKIEYKSARSLVYLTPAKEADTVHPLHIKDLQVTNVECKNAVDQVNERKKKFALGMKAAADVQMLFSIAESGHTSDFDAVYSVQNDNDDMNSDVVDFTGFDSLGTQLTVTPADEDASARSADELARLRDDTGTKLTEIIQALQQLGPLELNDFIRYYNQSRNNGLSVAPLLPEARQQGTLFNKICLPLNKIESILREALAACLEERTLQVIQTPK